MLSQKTVSVRIPGITPTGVTRYRSAYSVKDKIGACPDFPLALAGQRLPDAARHYPPLKEFRKFRYPRDELISCHSIYMLKSFHMLDATKMLKIQTTADSVARWGIIIFLGALPFFLTPNSWVTIPQAKMILLAIAIIVVSIAWIVARIAEGKVQIPKSFLLGVAAFLPISYLVSALVTSRTWLSFVGTGVEQDTVVAILLSYSLFLFFALVLSRGMREITLAFRALFIGGAVLVIIQLWQIAFPEYSGFGGALPNTVSSAIGGLHDLAIFLGLIVFLSISSSDLLDGTSARLRLARIFAGVVSLAFLLIINSSDVWLGLAVVSAFYGVYLWFDVWKSNNVTGSNSIRATLPYIILSILALGLSYGGTAVNAKLPPRLQLSQVEVRPSWQGTFTVGKQSFKSAREFIVGSGPNTFTRTWGLYKPLSVNATQFWNTDFFSGIGLIPTSLLSVGILGLLSWGALLVAILSSVVRFVRDRRFRTPLKMATGVILAGILYLFVFNVVYIPGVALSALLFALLGIFVALNVIEGKVGARTFSLNWMELKSKVVMAGVVAFGAVIIFGGIESLRALVSDTQVNRAIVTYGTTSDLNASLRYNGYALSVLGTNDRAHRTAVEIGLLQLKQLLAEGKISDSLRARLQETLTTTLQHGISAVSSNSNNYRNWLSLAQLYGELSAGGIEGADKNSRESYERARLESPTSPLPLLGLAQLDLTVGDAKSAREHLNAAIAMKSDFTVAHLLLSQLNAKSNDLAKAQDEAIIVAQLSPQDPFAWYNLGLVLYTRKSYKDSASALERAVQLQPNYANAIFLLGLSYYHLGRESDAISAFDEVARLNPSDPMPKKAVANVKDGQDPLNGQNAR